MNVPHQILAVCFATLLAACGSDVEKKSAPPKDGSSETNNGQVATNNGQETNNGQISQNNGQVEGTNNGTVIKDDSNLESLCGNGVLDEDEACDGEPATTCEELGFDGGYTQCSENCLIDVSACERITCGDGILDEDEVCDDGPNNGSYDACNENCSGLGPHCGDGAITAAEQCDGANLDGATCQNIGYDGGTLGCSTSCTLETSACTTAYCGDGNVDSGESCDDGAANGSYGACNASCTGLAGHCGDGVLDGAYEDCDGASIPATCSSLGQGRGTLSCTASCTIDTTSCSFAPQPGEIVISEIMQNPYYSYDNDGEWFEVYNKSAVELDLDGCLIESGSSNGPESFTVTASARIGAGAYFTFARSSNPGFVADYVYSGGINLNNYEDYVRVVCNNVEIDRVAYDDGVSFPDPDGASMTLRSAALNATMNDLGYNWCTATTMFGSGDRGTPGSTNDAC